MLGGAPGAAPHGGRTGAEGGAHEPVPLLPLAQRAPLLGAVGTPVLWGPGGLKLPHLAFHSQEVWLQRLRAPARLRPAVGERILMRYSPRPLEGDKRYCRTRGGPDRPRRRGCRLRSHRDTEA